MVLSLDCGSGYLNVHMIKSHGRVHTGCVSVSLLILMLCYSYVGCRLLGANGGKSIQNISLLPLQHFRIHNYSKMKKQKVNQDYLVVFK